MRNKFLLKTTILLFIGVTFFARISFGKPVINYRAWQFLAMKPVYVLNSMKLAHMYDINTVIFAEGMVSSTSQLFDSTGRGEQLKLLARDAHKLGLRVWIRVHELENVPARFIKNKIVQMDENGFWTWLGKRYEKVFNEYPEFDGVMMTFDETEYKIFDNKEVHSGLSMPERFAKTINTIDNVCRKYGKDYIVRTFVYQPDQLEWIKEGLRKTDSHVMVQSKCVPHDWDPYYPDNPVIGAFPDHKQIIEFDGSSEFTGLNRVPYAAPGYFVKRWKYDLSKQNVVGYDVRVDHGGYDAIYTPNEINLYTLYRVTQDTSLTVNDIWKEWTIKRYGRSAALYIENALKPTFDIVNDSFFALGFWITSHSRLPSYNYADGHIVSRTLAKWNPGKPFYKELENKLKHPDPEILEKILAQKDSAVSLAQISLEELQKAKPYLTPGEYHDLNWRLELLLHTAIVWKLHAEAFFGLKVLEENMNVPGLKARVKRAINSLYLEARVSEDSSLIGDHSPASARQIKRVAEDLEKRLAKL